MVGGTWRWSDRFRDYLVLTLASSAVESTAVARSANGRSECQGRAAFPPSTSCKYWWLETQCTQTSSHAPHKQAARILRPRRTKGPIT
ncbi:hypothetical protein BD309DRAFT_957927 [Dichomitus squalens]|nr:hypothetical protein BD309DRAFT_957927 [Dichomitus squalens]